MFFQDKLPVLVTKKEIISLLAHKHSAVIKCKDFEKMVQKAANSQREKTTQSWKSGFVRNEMTGNGQMRGY